MEKMIAYCGLDCGACEARTATVQDDSALRRKVAEHWSELNHTEITPDMINCMGCRADGVKTPFCEALCPIRQCALSKEYETCGDCLELDSCEKVKMILDHNPDARERLKKSIQHISVCALTDDERDEALALAWKVFSAYEAPDYTPEGAEEFRQSLNDPAFLHGIRYYGAYDGDTLVGMAGIRPERCHICFFFVDGMYHRRGIGTKLFGMILEDFPDHTITLNSSPYGIPFYTHLGFEAAGREQTVNGIRFTPMEYRKAVQRES